ncbi:MAG: protein-L-isoaspartate O-methyltransferase [Rhodospirillales bacterium]|nr:protein-L-isoaspartate O-methyltransferase [Rhodospirillales bacterium]
MALDYQKARENMVDGQIHTAGVVSEGILQSFSTVPRELFLPEKLRGVAYVDESLPMGKGRHLLEPMVHAKMLQAARLQPNDVVLDIGVGAGYSSAILSPLVTTVVALDDNKRYLDKAARLWDKLGSCNVVAIEREMTRGTPEHAPFSLIFINGAIGHIPRELTDQLGSGGRLLTVLNPDGGSLGQAVLVEKTGDTHASVTRLFDASVPYLPGFEPAGAFSF